MQDGILVGGFEFAGENDAKLAMQEKKKIEYLEKHMDYSTSANVLQVYNKSIQERLFKTPIGYTYLKNMQEYLTEQAEIPNEDILPIKLFINFEPKLRKKTSPAQKRIVMPEVRKQKRADRLVLSVLINIVLVIIVGAMFAITIKGDNPNILNYEKAIINRYAEWEQQLTVRERKVREKEREFNIENNQ